MAFDSPTAAEPGASPVRPLRLGDFAIDAAGFAEALGQSFRGTGFAIIADHGIDQALIEDAWAETRALFARPEAEKRRHHRADMAGARGYTPFGVEIAKGAQERDLKEFWHIGRELPPGSPLAATMPANVWPEEGAAFQRVFKALFAEFDRVGGQLLAAVAMHLGLAPDWFARATSEGNSVLRLLHYPPVAAEARGVRAEAHEDINLITLLLGAEEAGLQLLDRQGQWRVIDPPPGALVVNVGDMLQRLTNHVLPSTTHRVVNPAPERRGESRYSVPFFLHLPSDFVITTLSQCVTADNPDRYPQPILADDYLNERLREIGLLKT